MQLRALQGVLKNVARIKAGELQHLRDCPELMAMVEAVFAVCDADGNGEIHMEEMVARYGKQAGHMLKVRWPHNMDYEPTRWP